MKKLLLIFFGAAALTFQSCVGKDNTADNNDVIDDGMHTSETTIGSGSTRPSDANPETGSQTNEGPVKESTTEGYDTVNTETGTAPVETGTTKGMKKD